MGMHQTIEAKPDAGKELLEAEPVGADAISPTASEASAAAAETAKIALATIESIKVETPMMALASIEAPKIAPSLDVPKLDAPKLDTPKLDTPKLELPNLLKADEVKPAAAQAAPSPEAPATPRTSIEPPPRVSRFTLLAASLVLCGAFGAMIGTLVAAIITRPVPVAQIASPPGRPAIADINALKEQIVQARIDLANLKASVDAGNRNASTQFSRLGERVDRMERNQAEPVAKLGKAIEALERRADQAKSAKDTTESITPPQPAAEPKDSSRLGVVDGWVLREVERGTAIIQGRLGLMEVDQGDVVPGVGRVQAIRKQDGRWVVVTPKGLIVQPR